VQQLLSSQQEEELVEYIGALTACGLPPTRAIIQNFASILIEKARWRGIFFLHFINYNYNHLSSKRSAGMEIEHHQANSRRKYKLYFDLLHCKIVQCKGRAS
jgi:hypothetical protein